MKAVSVPLPGKPSSAGGINHVLAVDAEHKHGAILSQKVNNQHTNTTTKQKQTPPKNPKDALLEICRSSPS